jgi:glyoxylate reductase
MDDKPRTVFITYRIPEESVEPLLEAGYKVLWPAGRSATQEEYIAMAGQCDAILTVFGNPVPEGVFTAGGRLHILSNFGAGVDNINLDLATERGVVVTNTPDQVTEPTAEMAMALMLSLVRRVAEMDRRLRQDKKAVRWGVMENLGMTLQDKTLGIVGMGRIGKATARRALSFGMKIVYFQRHRLPADEEEHYEASLLSLEELLATADVVSLHTPLTEETRHLLDAAALERMKPSAVLVNTARGAVVDEQALIQALQKKQIAGAALDVFEHEPEIPDELLALDNVVAVPHLGTATLDTRIAIGRQAAQNILDFFEGRELKYCVNPKAMGRRISNKD